MIKLKRGLPEGLRRWQEKERLKKRIASEKWNIKIYENQLRLVRKLKEIGIEGVDKRLTELAEVAKEIDELRELKEFITYWKGGPESCAKRTLDEVEESYQKMLEETGKELEKLEKELETLG